jgi:hypothetical protein
VIDAEASELHRIERDLHDGAQQRLVALTIDLGLASERLDEDPAAGAAADPRRPGAAREALAEIRQLVRGIAPSILLDRGLVAALESIIARGPMPTSLVSDLRRACGSRRGRARRLLSSSPRRSRTWPSTRRDALRGPLRRERRRAASSSRSGMTAAAARTVEAGGGWPVSRAASPPSTAPSPCRARRRAHARPSGDPAA